MVLKLVENVRTSGQTLHFPLEKQVLLRSRRFPIGICRKVGSDGAGNCDTLLRINACMDPDRCTEAEQGRIRDERDTGSADFPTNSQGENDDFSKTAISPEVKRRLR